MFQGFFIKQTTQHGTGVLSAACRSFASTQKNDVNNNHDNNDDDINNDDVNDVNCCRQKTVVFTTSAKNAEWDVFSLEDMLIKL